MIGLASGARLVSQSKRVAMQTKCLGADHLTFDGGAGGGLWIIWFWKEFFPLTYKAIVYQVFPCKIFFPSKSVCRIFFSEITLTPYPCLKSQMVGPRTGFNKGKKNNPLTSHTSG